MLRVGISCPVGHQFTRDDDGVYDRVCRIVLEPQTGKAVSRIDIWMKNRRGNICLYRQMGEISGEVVANRVTRPDYRSGVFLRGISATLGSSGAMLGFYLSVFYFSTFCISIGYISIGSSDAWIVSVSVGAGHPSGGVLQLDGKGVRRTFNRGHDLRV